MTAPKDERGPGWVQVRQNRQNARRSLCVRAHQERELTGLVKLTIYNMFGGYAYDLSMTQDEADALADALKNAPWSQPS